MSLPTWQPSLYSLSSGGSQGGERPNCYFSRLITGAGCQVLSPLILPLLPTLTPDPSAGDPSFGRREEEQIERENGGKSVVRAEQEKMGEFWSRAD